MSRAVIFKRFVIVRNPNSTNAHVMERRIDELRQAAPNTELLTVQTSANGRASKRALLRYADRLGPETLLCIAGGDGTVNLVVEALLGAPDLPAAVRQTPLLPLWGGNANDLAHMLNGSPSRVRLPMLVTTGEIVKIFPLECRLTEPGGVTTTYRAACYASFGASAYIAYVLDRTIRQDRLLDKVRFARFVHEFIIAVRALTSARMFRIQEVGRNRRIFESTFFNGPRFAKITRVKRQLADKTFHRSTVDRKQFVRILLSMVELARSSRISKFEGTHADFTITDAIWAQFDGETVRIKPGTHVAVSMSEQPFYALAAKKSR